MSRKSTKLFVILSLVFLFMLGVNYRPKQDFDYSKVVALETLDGVTKVDFKFLGGFDYEDDSKIPEPVMQLKGERVKVAGFMLPVDFEEGRVNSFLLMNSKMACCFGVMPRINEFVFVKMPEGKTAKFMSDIPISVSGLFNIGEENLVDSLYTMIADKVEKMENL